MTLPVTEQQKRFFQTFGYLNFPGLFRENWDSLTAEFEAAMHTLQTPPAGTPHDGTKHTGSEHFFDLRPGLGALLDDPRLIAAASGLLGDDFNYIGSDGHYYVGDTLWHPDEAHSVGTWIKFAFYLDPVTRETGALRVIPGSHRPEVMTSWEAVKAMKSQELWGIAGRDVPAVALETQPGDLLAFDMNIMHAAFGGGSKKRMLAMNMSSHASTPEEVEDLRAHVARHHCVSRQSAVLRDAGSERLRHLRQVAEMNEKEQP